MISLTNGAIINKYDYSPFGQLAKTDENVENVFKFSSEYAEKETGLIYYNYRYYNPTTGKWLKRDPIQEAGGLNLYGFALNSAINYWDNLGLKEYCLWEPTGSKIAKSISSGAPKSFSNNEKWLKGKGVKGQPNYIYWEKYVRNCYYNPFEEDGSVENCAVIIMIGHAGYVSNIHNYKIPKCSRVGTLGCYSGKNAQPPKENQIKDFPKPEGKIGWSKDSTSAGYESFGKLVKASIEFAEAEAETMSQDCKCKCEKITIYINCQRGKDSATKRLNKWKHCNKAYKTYNCQKNKKK
ncbi:RHS repeat-associated core domain-containing protein [Lentisphaerota bacterium WC36G]|nr:RHS repeat-associated core domain-containing protein [Lentisphaerae bacterium WC36]